MWVTHNIFFAKKCPKGSKVPKMPKYAKSANKRDKKCKKVREKIATTCTCLEIQCLPYEGFFVRYFSFLIVSLQKLGSPSLHAV